MLERVFRAKTIIFVLERLLLVNLRVFMIVLYNRILEKQEKIKFFNGLVP
jgi:hypothetical protein